MDQLRQQPLIVLASTLDSKFVFPDTFFVGIKTPPDISFIVIFYNSPILVHTFNKVLEHSVDFRSY